MRKQTLKPQPMSQGRLKLVSLVAYSFGEFLCDLIISEDTNEKDIRRHWILESERRDLMHPSILMNQIVLKRVSKGLTQIELKQQLRRTDTIQKSCALKMTFMMTPHSAVSRGVLNPVGGGLQMIN